MPVVRHYRRDLGARFSEGARLLWAAVLREGLTMRALRDRVAGGADVTRWLYGDTIPPLAALVSIERLWGIPTAAWLAPPKRAFVPPAARAA